MNDSSHAKASGRAFHRRPAWSPLLMGGLLVGLLAWGAGFAPGVRVALAEIKEGSKLADELVADKAQGAWVDLFNGKDLSNWVPINTGPDTFSVKDGVIYCTGKPISILRTDRHYENFIAELEWRHLKPGGNAGFFVWSDPITARGQPFTRAIEVQVLDGQETANYTSHGDIFPIHGARMKPERPHPGGWDRSLPSERRAKPSPQWNHYRVECRDGTIRLAVNGKFVSGGSNITPRKGYICLESEGSPVEFRNIRIMELPSTNAKPADTAMVDEGFKSIYNGTDLAGWVNPPGHAKHWAAQDWTLNYDGKSEAPDKHLWTGRDYRNFEMICDWRWTAKPVKKDHPVLGPDGKPKLDDAGKPIIRQEPDAGESGLLLRGSDKAAVNIWCAPAGSGGLADAMPKLKADAAIGSWNRFHITLKNETLTVKLNGKLVIENAPMPGLPARGPIGLRHAGSPIQFANIYIKELAD